jgi:hypothetical protein
VFEANQDLRSLTYISDQLPEEALRLRDLSVKVSELSVRQLKDGSTTDLTEPVRKAILAVALSRFSDLGGREQALVCAYLIFRQGAKFEFPTRSKTKYQRSQIAREGRSLTVFRRPVPARLARLRPAVARLIQSSKRMTAGVRAYERLQLGSTRLLAWLASISQGIVHIDDGRWHPSRRLAGVSSLGIRQFASR